MYEVIGSRVSRSFRVLWMMEELGLDYTHTPAKPHSPEADAANPAGKIPSLRVDGTIITDSVAIMTYLADKYGRMTYPAGTLERARQDGFTQRILDELDSVLWCEGKQRYFAPDELRSEAVTRFAKWDYERNIKGFADVLEGEFLLGNELMVPDILLGNCLIWGPLFGFAEPGPKLAAYVKRLQARPAYQRAAAMP